MKHGPGQITPDREQIEDRGINVKLNLQPGVMDICGSEGK